jgi:hypothetical protein
MPEYMERDERVAMGGPVPANWTYTTWLKRQNTKIKKEILGEYYDSYKNGISLEEIAGEAAKNKAPS